MRKEKGLVNFTRRLKQKPSGVLIKKAFNMVLAGKPADGFDRVFYLCEKDGNYKVHVTGVASRRHELVYEFDSEENARASFEKSVRGMLQSSKWSLAKS